MMLVSRSAVAVVVVALGVVVSGAQTLQSSHQPAFTVSTASAPAVASGKPVARVNGVTISQAAYDEEVRRIFPYSSMHGNQVPKEYQADVRQKALNDLIDTELAYQEARRRNLQITPAEWQKRLSQVRAEYGSQAQFDAAIKRYFGSRAVFEDKLRHDMLLDKIFLLEVKSKAVVSELDVRNYYAANKARYLQPESVSFQTISAMFPKNPTAADKQAARQRIEKVLPRAQAAKTSQAFGLLAEKFSEDDYRVNLGDHQMVHRGGMQLPEFNAVFAMKVGETRMIESTAAYTIVRLNKHLPGKQLTFAEVRSSIRQQLEKERLTARNQSFHESLRKRAKVEIL